MEEVPRKVPMQGIKVWWAEKGDRSKRRRWRGSSSSGRKEEKREMTSESHDLPDKYLGITSGGPSAGPVRTVREAVVTGC